MHNLSRHKLTLEYLLLTYELEPDESFFRILVDSLYFLIEVTRLVILSCIYAV